MVSKWSNVLPKDTRSKYTRNEEIDKINWRWQDTTRAVMPMPFMIWMEMVSLSTNHSTIFWNCKEHNAKTLFSDTDYL